MTTRQNDVADVAEMLQARRLREQRMRNRTRETRKCWDAAEAICTGVGGRLVVDVNQKSEAYAIPRCPGGPPEKVFSPPPTTRLRLYVIGWEVARTVHRFDRANKHGSYFLIAKTASDLLREHGIEPPRKYEQGAKEEVARLIDEDASDGLEIDPAAREWSTEIAEPAGDCQEQLEMLDLDTEVCESRPETCYKSHAVEVSVRPATDGIAQSDDEEIGESDDEEASDVEMINGPVSRGTGTTADWLEAVAKKILASARVKNVTYVDDPKTAFAYSNDDVEVPPPTTLNNLYVLARTAAYVALRHDYCSANCNDRYEVERWAHKILPKLGAVVPSTVTQEAKADLRKAVRYTKREQPWEHIAREVIEWCRSSEPDEEE